MKVSTWILVGLLLAGAVGGFVAWRRATEPARAWAEFLELEGVEVRHLSGPPRLRAENLFRRFAPIGSGESRAWKPWVLLGSGSRSWMALHVGELPSGYDGTDLHVRLAALDGEGYLRGVDDWKVGMGVAAVSARSRFRTEAEGFVIEVVVLDGSEASTLIFGRSEDGTELVRVEDSQGRLLPKVLRKGDWRFRPPDRGPAWLRRIEDERPLESLPVLLWLGLRFEGTRPGSSATALVRKEVVDRLETLRTSPNPWIREAAALALRP